MSMQYKNPPIREAVCEFRFHFEGAVDIAIPGLVFGALRGEFPDRKHDTETAGQLGITFGSIRLGDPQGGSPQVRMGEAIRVGQGLRFWREDSVDGLIVVRQDRMSISHYAPYRSWEAFQPDILLAFEAHKTEAKPDSIQRVGLRYINDIHFQEEFIDLEEFFNYYPNLGETLPQDYSNLSMVVQFEFEEGRDRLRLGLSTRPIPESTGLIAQLDLDYALTVPGAISSDNVAGWLDTAHQHLGDVFELCLTDKARDLFQEGGS